MMELLVQGALKIRDDGQDHAERVETTRAVLLMLQEELANTLLVHGFVLDTHAENRVHALIIHHSEMVT